MKMTLYTIQPSHLKPLHQQYPEIFKGSLQEQPGEHNMNINKKKSHYYNIYKKNQFKPKPQH